MRIIADPRLVVSNASRRERGRVTRRRLAVGTASYVVLAAAAAQGATKNYVGPNGGSWGTASNWSLSGVPATGDDVILAPTDGISRLVNYASGNSTIQLSSVEVGGTSAGTITLSQGKDVLNAGFLDLGGAAGASGAYQLSGGTLTATFVEAGHGGVGQITQTGGLLQAANDEELYTAPAGHYPVARGS